MTWGGGGCRRRISTVNKSGTGSKNVKKFYFARKNGLTERFYRRERGPGLSVTAGVPFLSHNKCHRIEKSVTQ